MATISSTDLGIVAGIAPLLPTPWAVISSFLIFVLGLLVLVAIGRSLGYPVSISGGLYLWHSVFCLAYAWYVTSFGGDAVNYYRYGLAGGNQFRLGTGVVRVLTGLLIDVTKTSFLGVSLIFNIAGAIGLLLHFDVLVSVTNPEHRRASRLVWIVVLLPSASFWSSGLGKDSVAFMAAALLTWAALNMGRRYLGLVTAIAIMFLFRPHIAGVMLVTLLVSVMGSPQRRIMARVFHAAVVAAVITVALPAVTTFLGLGDAQSLDDVNSYIDKRQGYNQEGEAGVDISQLPVPLQIVTFVYRPLPYEAWSIFAVMAAAENLLLIGLTALAVNNTLHGGRSRLAGRSMYLWLYFLGATYILAITTANLGIAVRQKWMVMTPLFALLLAAIDRAPAKSTEPPGQGATIPVLRQPRPEAPRNAPKDRESLTVRQLGTAERRA